MKTWKKGHLCDAERKRERSIYDERERGGVVLKFHFRCFAREALNSNKHCTALTSDHDLLLLSSAASSRFLIR